MVNSLELFRRAASLYRDAVLMRMVELNKKIMVMPKGYIKASCEQDIERAKCKARIHDYHSAEEYLDLVQARLDRS